MPPPPPPPLDAEREADRLALARTRWLGLALIPLSLGWMWYFLLRPLQEAARTGRIEYSMKAVIVGPMFLYLGAVMLCTDLRDGQIRWRDEAGNKHYTRKGWLFIAGTVVVCLLTILGWTWVLHRMGFQDVL